MHPRPLRRLLAEFGDWPHVKRYQLYYRLIEFSFWITAIWLVSKILGMTALRIDPLWDAIGSVYVVLYPFNILLSIFLVLARFMRDEYAERIWQQTARRFVNFMMVGPLVVTILIILNSKRITSALPGMMHPQLLEILASEKQPAVVFFSGIGATFLIVAQLLSQLFVLFYRWGLWRDSR